jgi:RluA family pseudouridine synthase
VNLLGAARAVYGRDLANVHRLDAAASGVLLCAKTKPALDFLSGQFQAKTVEKRYLALVAVLPPERALPAAAALRAGGGGLPAEFAVDLALDDDETARGRMRVCSRRGGRASTTAFRVLESFGALAWVECRPLTGRPHQVRVHLAAVGAPVLNDDLYGDPAVRLLLSDLKRRYKGRDEERPLIGRLALHASELGVTHPASREPLRIAAPLPREFEIALRNLRRYAPAGFAKR